MPITLEELSGQLDISPSGLRKRIHSLGLQVEKGSRGKWIIPDELLETLMEADRLMKDGAGTNTTRRVLGITIPSSVSERAPIEDVLRHDYAPDDSTGHGLRTDLGANEVPASDRSLTEAGSPELRQALEMLAAERARFEALQGQLVELLEQNGDMKNKIGMFQERSLNLAETVKQLESKVLMLEAPKGEPMQRPWWKLWG